MFKRIIAYFHKTKKNVQNGVIHIKYGVINTKTAFKFVSYLEFLIKKNIKYIQY